MSTATAAMSSAEQLRRGRIRKTVSLVIRHVILALLSFIWLVPIFWPF